MRILIVFFFSCFLFLSPVTGQYPPVTQGQADAQVRAELEKKGLEEDVFRKKLMERGIDIDNIDNTNPNEVFKLQKALEEVTREIELEKKEAQLDKAKKEVVEETTKEIEQKTEKIISDEVKEVASGTADEITDAVKDGATIEEALAEGIIDAQKDDLPPAVIFGQHIFRNKEIGVYRNANDIIAPNSYILGAGDKIAIALWGRSELDVSFEINKEGFIKPEGMPRINLKGISLVKAKELLRSRFSNYYRFGKDQFEVTVTYPRTITVHLVGEVMNSGSYTMPAINTVFNALAAADGPSDIGSVRSIKLIRAGTSPKQIDIYEYLLNPTINEDYYLQDNDVIHVDVAEKVVSIQGSIRRPFKYELKSIERMKDLIDYAGGLDANAYQSNLQVKRFEDDLEKIVNVNYNDSNSGKNFQLQGGDEIIVGEIPKPYKNFVEIMGAVDLPGEFELKSEMRVRDLIQAGKLSDFARLDVAYLLRTNTDNTLSYSRVNIDDALNSGSSNIALRPGDKLLVYSKDRFLDKAEISVNGAVRVPSKYAYDQSETLKIEDLIILAGGLRKDAIGFGYIHRVLDPLNPNEKEYIRVDIQKAVEAPESTDNIVLQPNDRLEVFSKLTFTDEINIDVRGAVRNPGKYRYDESLTLQDALALSGGLKITASRKKVDVFRMILDENNDKVSKTIVASIELDDNLNSGNNFKLNPYDIIVVRKLPGFKFQRYVTIEGAVKYPGGYALLDEKERLSSLVKRSGGTTPEAFPEGATLYREKEGVGFIVLRLDKVLKDETDIHNFILKQGDVINIPEQKDLVTITGATRATELYSDEVLSAGKFNVAFNPKKRAKWYVDEYAAGVGENGRRRLITVEHPNGRIERTKNYLVFKIHPKVRQGSVIKVGYKAPEKTKEERKRDRKDIDWGKVLADSVAQATAVLSLILLLERVN